MMRCSSCGSALARSDCGRTLARWLDAVRTRAGIRVWRRYVISRYLTCATGQRTAGATRPDR